MDKINIETGKKYIPHFIRRGSDLEFGSIVTHEDYNDRFNLNAIQGDYNTETLRLLLTIANSEDVPHVPYIDDYINKIIDELDTKTKDTDLATVAKSGSYTDLSNTPTKLSSFENDTNYVDTEELNNNLTILSKELVMLLQDINKDIADVESTASTANTNAESALTLAQSYGAAIANKQDQLTAGDNINIIDNVISATDTTYIAGDNVTIVDNVISSTDTKYTAGTNITIDENNVISSTGGGGGGSAYELPIASDTVLGGIKVGANLTITEDGTLNAEAGGSTGGGTVNSVNGEQPDATGNVQLMQVITPEYTIDGNYYVVDITNLKAGTYMIPPFATPAAATSSYPNAPKLRFKCLKPGTTDTYLINSVGNVSLYYYPVFILLQTDVIEGLNALAEGTLTTFRPGSTVYVGFTDHYERTYYNYSITIRTTSITIAGGSSNPLNAITTKNVQQTISGLKKFNVLPQSTVVPADDADLVNKLYVDTAVANAGGSSDSATYVQTDTNVPVLQVLDALENPSKYTKVNSNSLIIHDGNDQVTITPTSLSIAGVDILNRYSNLGLNTKGEIGVNSSGNEYIRTTFANGTKYQLAASPSGLVYQHFDGENWSNVWGDSGWINIPLASGVSVGTISGTPKYRKLINKVDIKGSFAFSKGTGSTLLGTLPEGYRPPEQFYFFAPLGGTRIARFYINTSGQIYCEWVYNIEGGIAYTGNIGWTSFNVSFYTN